MPIKATDLKRGVALMWEGQLHLVLDTEHVKPGKGPAYVQAKMKNVGTGTIKVNRLNSSDKLDDVSIDKRSMQYLYDSSGQGLGPFVFMDGETYDQIEIGSDSIPVEQSQWLKENVEVLVMMYDGRCLGVDLPAAVELEVTENIIMKNVNANIDIMKQLSKIGIRISIDDFGTGFSSLGYLANLPVDVLKIDRMFTTEAQEDQKYQIQVKIKSKK